MSKKKYLPAILILIIVAIMFAILFFLSEYVPLNDLSVTGNTAGNLNNRGLFCERDGIVYFSNPYDNNKLYSMNADETKIKCVGNVSVESINADDHFLYYYQTGAGSGSGLGYLRQTTGVYRSKKNGKDAVCLKRDPAGIIALCGSNLYYQHYTVKTGTYLDSIRIDKKNETTVLTDMVSPACVVNGTIYFAGYNDDHYLYALDTTTNSVSLVWEHNLYHPIYQDGYVYFMDLESNYELHRYNLASGEEEILSKDRLDFFNVYGNVIYYQKSSVSDPALKRINIDGTNDEIIQSGIFSYVNITSQYAYFAEYDKPAPIYHQPTYGPVNVSVFQASDGL